MNFSWAQGDVRKLAADLLVLPLFDGELAPGEQPAPLSAADAALDGLLLATAKEEGFKAKGEQLLVLHTHGKLKASRVLLLGLSSRSRFEPEVLRLAAGRAVKAANKMKLQRLAFYLPTTRV